MAVTPPPSSPAAAPPAASPGPGQGPAKGGAVKKKLMPKPLAVPGTLAVAWRELSRFRDFFKDDVILEDVLPSETDAKARQRQMVRLVQRQSYVIMGMVLLIILLAPVLRPIYKYRAMTPEKQVLLLTALDTPNQTNQAILSWATMAITEIMTFGFGDFDQRILAQKTRFTDDGWTSFTKGIRGQKLRENFKAKQLVLTTVPSNMPVITGKGFDENEEYQWIVEMPIIMTYTTNNNVTERKRGIVRLVIVQVPTTQNKDGIGIKTWQLL